MFGLSGTYPHYSMVVVDGNKGLGKNGLNKMTKEHIGITLTLKLPMLVVITKKDIAPPEIYQTTIDKIKDISKLPICNKMKFYVVKKEEDLEQYAEMTLDR